MSGTPRLRSAFPSTPQQGNKSPSQNAASTGSSSFGSPRLPDIGSLLPVRPDPEAPLIPFSTIDAPSQRLYVAGAYTALLFWRLWDFYHLTVDETESLWLFMKWVSIDGVFLFGLPGLRIPWLEWSSATMTVLFLLHALLDGVLMFRIPIPLGAGLVALTRVLYDREIAVSERRVKPGDIIHNPSLILGRQIIHILPEGSAVLNPENVPLCLDLSKHSPSVDLPMQINQTNPISIELVRFDLESSENETIIISASQTRKLRREAEHVHGRQPSDPLVLRYSAKKTGLYRLSRVIDETNLEVQRRSSEALIVTCPAATVKTSGQHRCRGELSDTMLEVKGTPPLRVRYRKTINGVDQDVSYQSIQPDDFMLPLTRQRDSTALVSRVSPDLSWATAHRVLVPLNETLGASGSWTYSIEEIADACNNVIKYTVLDDFNKPKAKSPHSEGSFLVHDRPRIALEGVNVQRPLLVAAGQSITLPLRYSSTGKGPILETEHLVEYLFTPADELSSTGDHGSTAQRKQFKLGNIGLKPLIRDSGLYTLQSVSTQFCAGEVQEPAACMLINPPKPQLSVSKEEISDKCAGRPIGLRGWLDLIGTPPFTVQYTVKNNDNRQTQVLSKRIEGSRGYVDLKPADAGPYTYKFTEVSDAVYKGQPLHGDNYELHQDVKPSVSAHFVTSSPRIQACIDEPVSFDVKLQGEGPWALEWELLHGGKRSKHLVSDIKSDTYTIKTDSLVNGGEYSLALVSVTDKLKCKESLQQDAKIVVRHQRPKASFGNIDGKRTVRTLAGKNVLLPLRLSGQAPWTLKYRHPQDSSGTVRTKQFQKQNDVIPVEESGTYEIVSVIDAVCPGSIDEGSSTFEVVWIGRPRVQIAASPLLEKKANGTYVRTGVCEGEEDALDIIFEGRPPFDVKYHESVKPDHGDKHVRSAELHVPLHSAQIKMDTAKAGSHEYVFTELGDYNYDHDAKQHQPLTVQQRVNAKPTVSFVNPGKVYSFCQGQESDSGEEVIPITLQGLPPFTVDLELKHNSKASRATPITFSNILTTSHELRIPHHHLQQGISALTIRRVRDARGCERQLDTQLTTTSSSAPLTIPRVQISVHEPPTINPIEPEKTHYCVGERIAFSLSGVAPFSIYYTFEGKDRKASVTTPVFRRIAETPGNFTITGIQDAASQCRGAVDNIAGVASKLIHALPSVRVSKGRESRVDIHAGGDAEILFEFGGVPPFEFTYTRSENVKKGERRQGAVLETKTLTSEGMSLAVRAGEEGTYEVVAIRDRFCSFSRPGVEGLRGANRLLMEA